MRVISRTKDGDGKEKIKWKGKDGMCRNFRILHALIHSVAHPFACSTSASKSLDKKNRIYMLT